MAVEAYGLQGEGIASARYSAYKSDREPFLIRARRLSRLTIPSLFREIGENGTTSETIPWQSLGGQGVNNLTSKLGLTMFPPGIPFMKLKATKKVLQGLAQMDPDTAGKIRTATDKGLSGVEREFIEGVEEDGDRAKLTDTLKHLLVGGNHCIQFLPDDSLVSISLDDYVTRRDRSGNLLEWIIETAMEWDSLPPDVQDLCIDHGYLEDDKATIQQPVNVYTHGRFRGGLWSVYQECWGNEVPGSRHSYTPAALPYLFLRMVALAKEHYGRSYCEDYEGDLQTLDGFWQILTEGAAAIAQLKWLVKPGGVTNKKAFAEAANGAVLTGDKEDVTSVTSEKSQDLRVASDTATKVESRLQRAFIMTDSIRRDGERVTAREISLMAQELEATLGGVYSNLIVTFQAHYARLKLDGLQRNGRVTRLPKGTVKVTILTGDAALGRQQDAQTLDEMLETANAVFPPNSQITPYVSIGQYLTRSASNRGIDTDGLVKSDDQVQAEQQQDQQAAMMQNVAPEAVRQVGQMAQNSQQAGLAQGAQQPPPQAPPQQAA